MYVSSMTNMPSASTTSVSSRTTNVSSGRCAIGFGAAGLRQGLHVTDLDGLFERRDGIVAHRRRVLVRHEARIAECGDGFHDEAVVELLRFVDVVPVGVAAGVEVADPLEVIAD